MVSYGPRRLPIPRAQYKANGYKPVLEKLAVKPPTAKACNVLRDMPADRPTNGHRMSVHVPV
jgi:hypothetical protein